MVHDHALEDSISEAQLPTELNPKNVHSQPQRFLSRFKPILRKATSINDTTGDDTIHYNSALVSDSVLKEEIKYLLFTNKNQDKFQVMPRNGSVGGTFWDSKRKTKILIHGLTSTFWMSSVKNIWTQHIFEIKDAYLKKTQDESYNVVVMDWTPLSTVPLNRYPDAAKATKLAGEDLAAFIFTLLNTDNLRSLEDIHILGHSLGAHVAGVTGNRMQGISEEYMIERITGLDPAGPCFDTGSGKLPADTEDILDKTDANFVDIIHTNMGNIIKTVAGRYGSVMAAGHVDFYPNGGEVQEGCSFLENRINYCSHQKSVVYYAQSISEKIVACPCDNWESYRSEKCQCDLKSGGDFFGEHCNKTARGKLYLAF
ncbi:Pancreatic lipase-related protein 2 [Orchesella cincta]|uniref:Pancreatic lipase-related protein 2 n=1 Tax=Orchesella cincta TaxID=48709 RepID=A0A1D2N9J8_ORCCI|nr:Pancreatic lipase-related protein 2 [Orchesella cincta]